jgi:hypothetical protein
VYNNEREENGIKRKGSIRERDRRGGRQDGEGHSSRVAERRSFEPVRVEYNDI